MSKQPFTTRKKLGEILVYEGKITEQQLQEILSLHKKENKPLGQLLLEHEYITQEDLTRCLGQQLGIPHVWLRKGLVDPNIVHVLPKEKARQFMVVPMFLVNNILTLATPDPNSIFVFDEVSKITGFEVQPTLARTDDILNAIDEVYSHDRKIDEVMSSLEEYSVDVVQAGQEKDLDEVAEMAEGSPVKNMVNMILYRAIKNRASDIHIEPQTDDFRVRIRIDGVLYELMSPKLDLHPAVISRLKVMAGLDIAERRMPQDGRIQVNYEGRLIDLRMSTQPGVKGEKVVLRILDKTQAVLDLNQLGFPESTLDRLKAILHKSYGLILVCGPTGSGKTTTLYSAISMLNTVDKNIVTIEDPVEYQLKGINQNQVNTAVGLDFARFLRHTLRQDPDIVLVGEIRDQETARIAIQASLTGHLVLATLHTNDAPSTITRLLEMGIEPYLLSSSLLACLAQRLVRTICPHCKTFYVAPKGVQKALGKENEKQLRLQKGKGCPECYDSGFKGRTSIYELLEIDDDMKRLILESSTTEEIRRNLEQKGHTCLKDSGYQKVFQGITTIEEVTRVTSIDV